MITVRQHGYTLMELLIVVTIIGILASIISSFFGDNVQKARCTEGRNAVLRGAAVLEKCRAAYGAYDNGNCDTSTFTGATPEGHFNVATSNVTPTAFTITATGTGAAAAGNNTICPTITINELGVQGGTGTDPW